MSCRDSLPVAVRAYTERTISRERKGSPPRDRPSEFKVIFDTETADDASQRLRIGGYQVRKGDALRERGLFFDPDALTEDDLAALRDYAAARPDLRLRPVAEFVEAVFFRYGYQLRGSIVGFNLPFDISRLAIGHSEARGSMRGGFSLKLSPRRSLPHVRVKHLCARAALIDFSRPAQKRNSEGELNRGVRLAPRRGFFVDVKTLAAALTAESFSLESLCDHLKTATRKRSTEEHGGPLTPEYLDYACADVQATWECFATLKAEYAAHGLSAPRHRIISEASIGKAYLKELGIAPLLERHPDFPRSVFGPTMCNYFGGRAEVRWRRTPKRVLYTDFKSMYPTVNALMGLWRFVTASGLTWRDGTAAVRDFLETVTAEGLQQPATWRQLTTLVRVKPDDDLFPVRAKYDGRVYTIGLNFLTCEESLWFTLADVIVAKLLTGRAPGIEEAIIFEPGPPQEGLKPFNLFGREEFRVDPYRDDVFRRLIDLRDEAKARGDDVQKAIKIVANATSYGIFVEVNRDDAPKPEALTVWGPDGEPRPITSVGVEQPGKFFNPMIATLITGAARLMLALAEHRVLNEGLDWVFCDTDSLAIAKPDDMSEAEFAARWRRVVDWFVPLNPYKKPGSILQGT